MKISILCEGRLNKGPENDLCNIYKERILNLKNSGILDFEIKSAPIEEIIKKSTAVSLSNSFFLDEKGKDFNTMDFVKKIKDLNSQRVKHIQFFIGGDSGFDFDTSKFKKISLSKFTLSHSLARVILCEQIYRCATIMVKHPYHRV